MIIIINIIVIINRPNLVKIEFSRLHCITVIVIYFFNGVFTSRSSRCSKLPAHKFYPKICFQICGVLTKLIPFVLTIVTYFTQFVPLHSKIADAFIKCLPIVCLIIFVGLCSMDMDRE